MIDARSRRAFSTTVQKKNIWLLEGRSRQYRKEILHLTKNGSIKMIIVKYLICRLIQTNFTPIQ